MTHYRPDTKNDVYLLGKGAETLYETLLLQLLKCLRIIVVFQQLDDLTLALPDLLSEFCNRRRRWTADMKTLTAYSKPPRTYS